MKEPAKQNSSMGECFLCHAPFPKSGILVHLKTCRAKNSPATEKTVRWLQLEIQGRYYPDYWMHVAIPGSRTLRDLDGFLRDVWLECCGHLSG